MTFINICHLPYTITVKSVSYVNNMPFTIKGLFEVPCALSRSLDSIEN